MGGGYQYQEGVWDKALRENEGSPRPKRGTSRALLVVVAVVVVVVVLVLALVLRIPFPIGKTSNPSYQISFSNPVGNRTAAVYILNLTLSASAALTTGMTGLKIVAQGGGPVGSGVVPSGCDPGTPFLQCLGYTSNLTGWFVLLLTTQGDLLSAYPVPAGSTAWSSSVDAFMDAGSISILSPGPLQGSGDTLEAFGTGSSTVTGSTTL